MSTDKKTTIKDIAEAAGVSLGTVHLALNNKKGVSEKTRARIAAIAKQMDYQPNYAASLLKRKPLRIVGCFPDVSGDNKFYYPQIWKGFIDAAENASREFPKFEWKTCVYDAFGFESENPYTRMEGQLPNLIPMEELVKELKNGEIDGFVTDGNNCPSPDLLREYTQKGTALVLTDTDVPTSGRISCVQADYEMIGRTMAEIITNRIPSFGSIFMCAGMEKFRSHHGIEMGFDAYMRENHCTNLVYKEHSNLICDENYRNILKNVERPDIAAVCCVSSRSSVMMQKALRESGKAGRITAIGSDIFEENNQALRDGVFQNLIQKNPYTQGYLATKCLLEYLTKDVKPKEFYRVSCDVVFRSTLPFYEKRNSPFIY